MSITQTSFITPAGWKTGIEEVAPKVYAYIQAFGELGVSNAGLLLDRDGNMAVDALMVPSMTRRFLAAIQKLSKRPVSRLVNTHHHIDHSGGNFLFRGAEVVSHTACRDEMVRSGIAVEAYQQRIPRFAKEFPRLKPKPPTVTFEDRLVFISPGVRSSYATSDRPTPLATPLSTCPRISCCSPATWPFTTSPRWPFRAMSATGSRSPTGCSSWTWRPSCPATDRSAAKRNCARCAPTWRWCAGRPRSASGWA